MLTDLWASTNRRLMHFELSSVRQMRKIVVHLYRAAVSGSR
jgi:hypothetical protein